MRPTLVLLGSVLALGIAGATVALLAPTAAAKQARRCQAGGNAARATSAAASASSNTLNLSGLAIALRFDESRSSKTDRVVVNPPKGVNPGSLVAEIEDDLKTNENREISPEGDGLTTTTAVTKSGDMRICVELDPQKVNDLKPGRYKGFVTVSGPGVERGAIPVEATFRDDKGYAIALTVAGAITGIAIKALSELIAAQKRRRSKKGALKAYFWTKTFALVLLLGAVTAWLGYVEIYESDLTWGVGSHDSLKLFGTVLGFQMASISGGDIAKRITGS